MTADSTATGKETRSRRRSLRGKLAAALILVALLSVVVLGVLNYVQVRSLLAEQVEEQLSAQGQARARSIREGLADIKNTVTVLARDPAVEAALTDFAGAYQALTNEPDLISEAERTALEDFYREEVTSVYTNRGVDPPPLADLLPTTDAAQYLQYHYIVTNPFPEGEREELTSAEGDTSDYRPVHEAHHPGFRALRNTLGFGDVLLIDLATTVVYTVEKRIDLGINLEAGPLSDTTLATGIIEGLINEPLGAASLVDFYFYVPADGAPVMFASAAVRSQGEPVGALAVTIPIERLNTLMTAQGQWKETGYGDTGESYVVGSDLTMRSDSRLWLEDPEAYLDDFADAGYAPGIADLIAAFDSTVLLQPAATEAVETAFDGERFAGRTTNYLGRNTLAVSEPVEAEDLSWVVVSELAWSEANDAIWAYTRRMLITAAILIPLVGLLGLLLADRMTRPIEPVVAAAADIANGQLDVEIPDLGRNEYGDVGRRINMFTADLRAQHEALEEEALEVTRLLRSALPDRVVKQLRASGRRLEDLADTATVIVLTASGSLEETGGDSDWATELGTRLSAELEASADRLGIERVRSAGANHVFVAGLGEPDVAADTAAEFTMLAITYIAQLLNEVSIDVTYHAALSSGDVIAGVLSATQLTYGVFGDPPRTAMALDSIATSGQVLVDRSTADELSDDWMLETPDGLVDLRGEPVAALLLAGRRTAEDVPAHLE